MSVKKKPWDKQIQWLKKEHIAIIYHITCANYLHQKYIAEWKASISWHGFSYRTDKLIDIDI